MGDAGYVFNSGRASRQMYHKGRMEIFNTIIAHF